jgi:hypothetical protein
VETPLADTDALDDCPDSRCSRFAHLGVLKTNRDWAAGSGQIIIEICLPENLSASFLPADFAPS